MAFNKHARAIIAAARRELQETNAADPVGNLWTNAELLEWANEGQDQVASEIAELDEDFFGDYFEIAGVVGQSKYDLPSRFLKMRQVEYVGGGARDPVPESRVSAAQPPVLSSAEDPARVVRFAYSLFADQIHFDPAPSTAVNPLFRCWFVGNPPELTYGKASAGAAGSITLQAADDSAGFGGSPEDDYYNQTWIVLTGGTGAGQRRRILDYSGSTLVASVTPNWSVTPNNTTEYATETVIPAPVWRMVQLFAAIAGKQKYGQDARALTARYNALYDSIPQVLERRTSTERAVEPFDIDDGVY